MFSRLCLRALEITNMPFAARDFGGFQGTTDENIMKYLRMERRRKQAKDRRPFGALRKAIDCGVACRSHIPICSLLDPCIRRLSSTPNGTLVIFRALGTYDFSLVRTRKPD